MKKITWKSERRKIADLNPAPYNPRQMTEKQAADLTTSIERFGLAEPIVINKNNTIIGGHQRINIIKMQRGVEEVDVMVPSRMLSDEEEHELNLRLNKNTGEWDFDALCNFDEDFLKDVGFDASDLDRIFQINESEKERGETMKRVYVAGAYSANNVIAILDNMRRGMKASTWVLLAGFAPFCPWTNFHFQLMLREDERLSVEDYYAYSVAWLRVSDAVLLLPHSENSHGTQEELRIARELGLPIYQSIEQLVEAEG